MSSTPKHKLGSAAEQGAKIRARLEAQQAARGGSGSHSKSASAASEAKSPSGSGWSKSQPAAPAARKETSEVVAGTSSSEKAAEPSEKASAPREKPVESEVRAPELNEKSPAVTASAARTPVKQESKVPESAPRSANLNKPSKLDKKGRVYPLTGIDNLALLMENDGYATVCSSMYLFKTELDDETVFRFFDKLADSYPKYRYRVELDPSKASKLEKQRRKAEQAGQDFNPAFTADDKEGRKTHFSKSLKAGGLMRSARWVYVDNFNVRDNIEILNECPGGKDDAALFEQTGKFMARKFDYTKPIWQALVIRGLDTAEGARSALIVKVHHCFSDGQGMIMSYHSTLGALDMDKPVEEVQAFFDRKTGSGEVKKPGQRNIKPTMWGTTKHGFHTARGLWTRPRKQFDYKPAPPGSTLATAGREGKKRAPGRLYHHSEGIPLADIKLIRQAFSDPDKKINLTLNDVACGVLSRALRLAAERTEKGPIRDKRTAIFVPISVRPRGNWDLANFTTGAIAWFAFYDPKDKSFEEQLHQVNREMARIKRSYWPKIWYNGFAIAAKHRIAYLPNYFGWQWFFERTYREYHVATNVPGPPKQVAFGEHKAFSYHVLPPSSPGRATLSIGMISYANDFSLAVSCDDVPEFRDAELAKNICLAFQDGAKELVAAAKAKLGEKA